MAAVLTTYENETKDWRNPLKSYVSPRMRRHLSRLAELDKRPLSEWIRLALEDVIRERFEDLESLEDFER